MRCFVSACHSLTISHSLAAPTREKDRDYENVRLIIDVLHEVDQKYVIDLDADRKRKLEGDGAGRGFEG